MKRDPLHPPSEDLFAYRDGELVPEKRALIEAHVMGCSVCRTFIDQVSALEAELRQSPDQAPAGYLEGLHESVRARIATGASEAGAGKKERRGDEEGTGGERGRVKEAPSLPWAAIISTVSAAAAVMVVVVILIKQGPYQRMFTPGPKATASRTPAAKNEVAPAPAPTEEGKDRLQKRADEVAMKTAPAPAPAGLAAREEANKAARPESMFQMVGGEPSAAVGSLSEEAARSPRYAAILARYGLPPLWDGARVAGEALANAEPEFRSLYMSGIAGRDSARVRLYLAEAARLRYAPGDSTLYLEILHHYRRAIELAGPDAETARVAAERLRTLER
jgi:putative zinc finger protein